MSDNIKPLVRQAPHLNGMGRIVFDRDCFGKPVSIWANPDTEALKNLTAKSKYRAMRAGSKIPRQEMCLCGMLAIQHYMPWWQRSLASI